MWKPRSAAAVGKLSRVLSFQKYHASKDGLEIRCKTCSNYLDRVRKAAIRAECLEAYGNKCSCSGCDEYLPQFLSIDHVGGGGNEHRKTMKASSIYEWLKRNGYPKEGFRLLCFNCNLALGFFGYCHTKPLIEAVTN